MGDFRHFLRIRNVAAWCGLTGAHRRTRYGHAGGPRLGDGGRTVPGDSGRQFTSEGSAAGSGRPSSGPAGMPSGSGDSPGSAAPCRAATNCVRYSSA